MPEAPSTGFPAESSSPARDVRAIVALSATEIATIIGDGYAERLRALLPAAVWFDPSRSTRQDWSAIVVKTRPEVVFSAWQTPPLPPVSDGLRYVCHCVGSVRGLVPRSLYAERIRVTNWGNVAAPLVAEHALLLLLGALRAMPQWDGFMAEPFTHEAKNRLNTRSLRGRRVSIHGFGLIARELIKLLKPFDVKISVYSVGVPHALIRAQGALPLDSVEALADETDILVTCEALTDATRGSIGLDVLSRLRPGGVFVNVGRGAVVDEAALAAVAVEKGLRLACDVFVQEPLPPDSPMRRVPGALYSPHMGGPTLDWYSRCGEAAVANVERYLQGKPLTNEVTLEMYDRST